MYQSIINAAFGMFFGWYLVNAKHLKHGKPFYYSVDLLFTILAIAVVAAIALPIFMDYKKSAVLINGYTNIDARTGVHVYYSLTGVWPVSENDFYDAKQTSDLSGGSNADCIKSVTVDRGAIHSQFTDKLDGQWLSMRPAVLRDEPLGPVIWVVGDMSDRPDWIIQGDDKTTVPSYVINRFLH